MTDTIQIIELPQRLLSIGQNYGITIPPTIEIPQTISQYLSKDINLGSIINQYVKDFIDTLSHQYITHYLTMAIITVVLLIIIIVIIRYQSHIPLSKLTIQLIQLILVVFEYFTTIIHFGILMSVLGGMILAISTIGLLRTLKEIDLHLSRCE